MDKGNENDELLLFLNTWEISNDNRIPIENLHTQDDLQIFSIRENTDALPDVRLFRNELRHALASGTIEGMNQWIIRRNVHTQMTTGSGKYRLEFFTNRHSIIDHILILVLQKVEEGQFHRYKICPDCQWAFYDASKSSTKKWCSMNKNSSTGRACGTIAKVRKYREKNKK
ncbi:CGNR zinc finger domain-containing protein [Cytobacillus spongiae]|uniref:CGNR zinc finger domain-containing protein n=1 Tax=Cytobacillus spongiae TaxID=2901381 RepID=UPI001F360481|nr:CGNR zinc finger domain-containing protein [Cytobacillus spongiae]UII57652.1 CGNR zinc finger domain-containing protein [Cytobacillus spongiae]